MNINKVNKLWIHCLHRLAKGKINHSVSVRMFQEDPRRVPSHSSITTKNTKTNYKQNLINDLQADPYKLKIANSIKFKEFLEFTLKIRLENFRQLPV